MSFAVRLKERREALGITQPELARILGVSKGAIGNYESGTNSPRATILYKLFDVLHCDANYLFQDELPPDNLSSLTTSEEFERIIKKYRALDPPGRESVDAVLEVNYKRCTAVAEVSRPLNAAESAESKISSAAV